MKLKKKDSAVKKNSAPPASEADQQRREFLKQLGAASSASLMPGVWTSAVTLLASSFKFSEAEAQIVAHSMWRSPSNTLWAWGDNTNGQLGIGTSGAGAGKSSPVQLRGSWAQISCGQNHALALKTNGTLWAWGLNSSGQLGIGNIISQSSPVQIPGSWTQITTGWEYSFGIKTDGTLWGWGYNLEGELGDGTVINRSTPVAIGAMTNWVSITAGYGQSLAVKADGTLWAWGWNSDGQVGNGTSTSLSSPTMIGLGTNWAKASAGCYHTLGLKTNGTLWAWGNNTEGQLGFGGPMNTSGNRSSPVQVSGSWTQISAGRWHSMGLQIDGTLWTWGYNNNGQLGNGNSGTGTGSATPVKIGTLTNWSQVSAGDFISAAIRSDSTLWIWGANTKGMLGDNTTVDKSSPVQLAGFWDQISGGEYATAGIRKK